jgi:hypothetical protein
VHNACGVEHEGSVGIGILSIGCVLGACLPRGEVMTNSCMGSLEFVFRVHIYPFLCLEAVIGYVPCTLRGCMWGYGRHSQHARLYGAAAVQGRDRFEYTIHVHVDL